MEEERLEEENEAEELAPDVEGHRESTSTISLTLCGGSSAARSMPVM